MVFAFQASGKNLIQSIVNRVFTTTQVVCEKEPFQFDFTGKYIRNKEKLPVVKRVKEKACPFLSSAEEMYKRNDLEILFLKKDFKSLNSEFDKYNGVRSTSGDSFIQSCVTELSQIELSKRLAISTEWNTGEFHSAYSECMLGLCFYDSAWEARGIKYISAVTDQQFAGFSKFSKQAESCFLNSIKLDNSFSPALVGLANTAGSYNTDIYFADWINLGLVVEPCNTSFFLAAYRYLDSLWYGSRKELVDLYEKLKIVDQKVSPTANILWKRTEYLLAPPEYTKLSASEKKALKKSVLNDVESLSINQLRPAYPLSDKAYTVLLRIADWCRLFTDFDRIYDAGIKKFPKSYELHWLKAKRLKSRWPTRYEERVNVLKKLIEIYPYASEPYIQLVEIGHRRKDLISSRDRKKYLKLAKKYSKSLLSRDLLLAIGREFLFNGKIKEVEEMLPKLGVGYDIAYAFFYGEISKFYYQKGPHFNPQRGWAYFMLRWSKFHEKLTEEMTLEEKLATALKNSPETADEWCNYTMMSYNYQEEGYFAKEVAIEGFRRAVELIDDKTTLKNKKRATTCLGIMLQHEKKYDEAIKYLKMSTEYGEGYWTLRALAQCLYYRNEAQKKKVITPAVCNAFTLVAEYVLKHKYHLRKYNKYYLDDICYAADLEINCNRNPEKGLELLTQVITIDNFDKEEKAQALLNCGIACRKLKYDLRSKAYLQQGRKLAKNKSTVRMINKELKKLK
jgi:hypothetical protein